MNLTATIIVVAVMLLACVLLWTSGYHHGWRKARQAELARVRERQRAVGRRARRTSRL